MTSLSRCGKKHDITLSILLSYMRYTLYIFTIVFDIFKKYIQTLTILVYGAQYY